MKGEEKKTQISMQMDTKTDRNDRKMKTIVITAHT